VSARIETVAQEQAGRHRYRFLLIQGTSPSSHASISCTAASVAAVKARTPPLASAVGAGR